jgi:quinol monooxygenase YgiN
MIIQVVSYICKEDQKEDFWKDIVAAKIEQLGKNECGNIRYNFYSDLEDKNVLLLVESWQDAKSLDDHYQSDNFKKLGDLKKKYVMRTIIEKYTNSI